MRLCDFLDFDSVRPALAAGNKRQLLQTLGQIAGQRIAPVVILTAFSQRDLVEQARDAGAMAYLVKPFQKHDLPPVIEMATARFAEIVALEGEVHGLNERLAARKLIERAKGVLMTQQGMSEPEAFRWIQRSAMDRRLSMRAVADTVLSGLPPVDVSPD